MSKQLGVEFFRQLDIFSTRFVKKELGLVSSLSPWGGGTFPNGYPTGSVIHYTADEDLMRVLRWFLVERYGANVSAHAVVADRKWASTAELCEDLPLVAELPVTVVQTRTPNKQAWHATWTNQTMYGIENINAGELRTEDGENFTTWRPRKAGEPDWTMPWSIPYKTPIDLYGRWWEPYTAKQVSANVMLLRYLQDYYGTLRPTWILPHECVQSVNTRYSNGQRMRTDKRDTGPAYPIQGVRDAVFDRDVPVDTYDWFKQFSGDLRYGESSKDQMVTSFVQELSDSYSQGDPSPQMSWARASSAFATMPSNINNQVEDWDTLALWLLGYSVNPLNSALNSDVDESVWFFQKSMGLTPDSVMGPATRAAMYDRLQDRGYPV